MELWNNCAGAVIQVPDMASAARWLRENLFFEELGTVDHRDRQVLQNGTCTLYLKKGEIEPVRKLPAGQYYAGLAHIALHAADIDEAIAWCRKRNLALVLDGNQSFYNPKVFGEGERYFNILSPFGVTFEVSERVNHPVKREERPIKGLDHLGVPCRRVEEELAFLAELGFEPLSGMVYNQNEKEGHISCSMVSNGELTLEVYQFTDWEARPMPEGTGLAGIAYRGKPADSPGGVHFAGTDESCL